MLYSLYVYNPPPLTTSLPIHFTNRHPTPTTIRLLVAFSIPRVAATTVSLSSHTPVVVRVHLPLYNQKTPYCIFPRKSLRCCLIYTSHHALALAFTFVYPTYLFCFAQLDSRDIGSCSFWTARVLCVPVSALVCIYFVDQWMYVIAVEIRAFWEVDSATYGWAVTLVYVSCILTFLCLFQKYIQDRPW